MAEVRIRRATASDRIDVDAVERAAFGAEGEHVVRLVGELRRTGAAVLELVAEADGGCVGHLLLSRGWVDAEPALVDVLVLSPLAVLPEAQRRGVGRGLIEHAVRWSEESAAPAVFLEGDPAYYAASGFVPAEPSGFRSPSPRIPRAAFQVRLLVGWEPWMIGPLVYTDAFWAADAVGLPRRRPWARSW